MTAVIFILSERCGQTYSSTLKPANRITLCLFLPIPYSQKRTFSTQHPPP